MDGLAQHAQLMALLGSESESDSPLLSAAAGANAAVISLRGGATGRGVNGESTRKGGMRRRISAENNAPSDWSVGPVSPNKRQAAGAGAADTATVTSISVSAKSPAGTSGDATGNAQPPTTASTNNTAAAINDLTATGSMVAGCPAVSDEFGGRRLEKSHQENLSATAEATASAAAGGPTRPVCVSSGGPLASQGHHQRQGKGGSSNVEGFIPRVEVGGARNNVGEVLAMQKSAGAAAGAGSSPGSPVMSLSGHMISPEVRNGEGDGTVKTWARDAFMKEAVTWEDFSRHSQVHWFVPHPPYFCRFGLILVSFWSCFVSSFVF